ncbi:MAG: rod shape-determining protein MreD [Acidimicrobiaceae bacterium]|nr:rod shape-determining protein MreD [Acidimicrobiaceae bacterium]
MTPVRPSAGMPTPLWERAASTQPARTRSAQSYPRLLSNSLGVALTSLRVILVFAAALLAQLTFFTEVRVAGVAPELPALLAILAGLLAGSQNGSVIAFLAGLAWDVYLPTPLGLAALTFAVVAYALGDLTEDLFHDTPARTLSLVFLGTAAMVSAYALLGTVIGQSGLLTDRLLSIVLVASLFNTVLAWPAAAAMRWALGISRDDAADSGAAFGGFWRRRTRAK